LNKNLCICAENWLFDLIDDRSFEEFFEPFGFVRFEFISVDGIVRFCQTSQDVETKTDLNLRLNSLVWRQLCNQLIFPVDISGVSHDLSRYSLKYSLKSLSPLFGIISDLITKHNENVSDKNSVIVTGFIVVIATIWRRMRLISLFTHIGIFPMRTIHGFVMISMVCESNQQTTLFGHDITEETMTIIRRIGLLMPRTMGRHGRRLMSVTITAN
jgi:hypothetical protein